MFKLLEVSRTVTQTVNAQHDIVLTSATKVLLPWPTLIGLYLIWPGVAGLSKAIPSTTKVVTESAGTE